MVSLGSTVLQTYSIFDGRLLPNCGIYLEIIACDQEFSKDKIMFCKQFIL